MSASEAASDPLQLDSQLCFPLYAATNLLQRLYRPLLEPLGLTYSQYLVMLVLWQRSPVPIGGLCERLHLDIGTLSPLLKRMERADLITRRRDVTDERRVLIDPTARGRALRDRAVPIPAEIASRTGMSTAEADDLRALMPGLITKLARAPA
ncbi:MarR family transcriptional regulator [Paracoccus sp. PXZ]|uniref:MarR family winged helix-turn-helix transcriptional regulator n=1 Tax=Pseudochrobactrum sp. B5 TaxID=1289478 RepID=UPI000951320C|nr:MarR family transcriptional regulator [Pseudochrobactrum sp. B5]